MKRVLTSLIMLSPFLIGSAQIKPMNQFINNLMSQMTIEEKIGQLNFTSSGNIVTGNVKNCDIAEKIRQGKVVGPNSRDLKIAKIILN